jgi:hypothetical protein
MREVLVALLLLAATPVAAQTTNPDVKAELQAFIKELNAALAARDRAALERLYALEFIFIHTVGPPVDRATHLANAMATAPRGALPVPSLDGLIVIGDVAILRNRDDERFGTTIYGKRNGRWQILQLQGTALPPPPSVAVAADVLRSYAGRYQQDNGLLVNIAVEGERLTLQGDGRQKFTLTALSPTQFSMPGGAGRITFAPDGTYEFQRPNQPIIKGRKQ